LTNVVEDEGDFTAAAEKGLAEKEHWRINK
jgi:hypothetical protein